MDAIKSWNGEVIKWLAVAICLAMIGMAVIPVAVGDAWAVGQYYLAKTGKLTPEASLAISLAAIWHSTVWGQQLEWLVAHSLVQS